jgi:hypothetical protein
VAYKQQMRLRVELGRRKLRHSGQYVGVTSGGVTVDSRCSLLANHGSFTKLFSARRTCMPCAVVRLRATCTRSEVKRAGSRSSLPTAHPQARAKCGGITSKHVQVRTMMMTMTKTCNCFDLCDIILFVNHNSNNASKAQCIVTQNPAVSNHAERHWTRSRRAASLLQRYPEPCSKAIAFCTRVPQFTRRI